MYSPRLVAGSALIVLVYLALGLTDVFTRAPWCDEAWFGNPAYNLAYKGFMGTTVLEPSEQYMEERQADGHRPPHLLGHAAESAGERRGVSRIRIQHLSMRLLSLFWGLIALCAWGAILWKLTGQPLLTLGSLGLIAVDYHFLMQASDGRMDVMAVALGWSGVAAYLLLRERNFPLPSGVSQSLAAMAFFTHPNGVMLAADSGRHDALLRPPAGAHRHGGAGSRSVPRDRRRLGTVHRAESGGFPGAVSGQRRRPRTHHYDTAGRAPAGDLASLYGQLRAWPPGHPPADG